MCFTFKKNHKQTKKPVNCFLQDDASAGIQSLQTSIEPKLCQNPWNRQQQKASIIDINVLVEDNIIIANWEGIQASILSLFCE